MTTIGQKLETPEVGWKRYDDKSPTIKYDNNWEDSAGASYGGSSKGALKTKQSTLWFNFIGNKIRIIVGTATTAFYSDKIQIKIDDSIIEYFDANTDMNDQMILKYENLSLTDGFHTVEIKVINSQSTASAYDYRFDAVDINEDGRLLHPDEVLDLGDLNIGKRIRCHYKANTNSVGFFSNIGGETYIDGINDFIPPTSDVTPNGDFYYICVDKDHLGRWKLFADRNLQHTISWDIINNFGIASGSGLNTFIPNSENNILASGIFTASSIYTTETPEKAILNLKHDWGSGYHGWGSGYYSGWWKVDLQEIKKFRNLFLTSSNGNVAHILISDDDITYTEILSYMGDGNARHFSFDEKSARYIKISIDTGKNWAGISGLYMDNEEKKLEYSTKLPTGGTSITDKDNEWDKYITNGNNNPSIWNHDVIWSWSSTVSSPSNYRAIRRMNSWDAGSPGSNYADTNVGFRPVLLVESLWKKILKFFIKIGTDYKKWNGTTLETMSITQPSKDLFLSDGMDNLEFIKSVDLTLLGDTPEIVMYTNDLESSSVKSVINYTPKPQIVKAMGDIDLSNVFNITSFESTAQVSGNGKVLYAVSPDSGVTWYTFDGTDFIAITSLTEDIVGTSGFDGTVLSSIPSVKWDSLVEDTKTIRFAYYLELNDKDDIALVDELVLKYQNQGYWESIVHGTDYNYAYVSNEMLRVKLFTSGDFKINYFRPTTETENPTNPDPTPTEPTDDGLTWAEFNF
jgi:hypothetical protein